MTTEPITATQSNDAQIADQMMAAPDKPTGYRIPAGVIHNDQIPEVTGVLHAAGYSQGEASKLFAAIQIAERQRGQNIRPETVQREMHDQLRRAWADQYDINLAHAKREAALLCKSRALDGRFKDTLLSEHPTLAKVLAARGAYRASKG